MTVSRRPAPSAVGIIGFGALGQQLECFLREQKAFQRTQWYLFDDQVTMVSSRFSRYPFADYQHKKFSNICFYVCLGYRHLPLRHEIVERLGRLGRVVGTFIHSTAYVHPSAMIGPGAIIFPGCIVDQRVVIESGSILNNGVVVSHDSRVGAAVFLAPRVTLCGNVHVGDYAFLGANAVVSNGISVGASARIGIGSVLTSNVGESQSFIGNPARRLKKPLALR